MAKDCYSINQDKLVWRQSGDNIVVLSMLNGNYFALNDSASFIWKQMCSGVSSISVLNDIMIEKFEVAADQSLRDLKELLEQLEKFKLVKQASSKAKPR